MSTWRLAARFYNRRIIREATEKCDSSPCLITLRKCTRNTVQPLPPTPPAGARPKDFAWRLECRPFVLSVEEDATRKPVEDGHVSFAYDSFKPHVEIPLSIAMVAHAG